MKILIADTSSGFCHLFDMACEPFKHYADQIRARKKNRPVKAEGFILEDGRIAIEIQEIEITSEMLSEKTGQTV